MYSVNIVPGRPIWPVLWAVYILSSDTVAALLTLPKDVLNLAAAILLKAHNYIGNMVIWKTTTYPQPPRVSTSIPFLGHLYNIFTKGSDYVKELDQKYRLPLFTMSVPGYRVYVATSPDAVRAIHKNPKTMEFTEIQRIAMRKLFNYTEDSIDTLGVHLNGDGTLKLINKPGPELDEVNEKAQEQLAMLMGSFNTGTLHLGLTLRRTLTNAICAALWGSEYPLLFDDSLEEDFWTWVHHFWSLLILPDQALVHNKGRLARERLCDALLHYTQSGGHRQASKVVSAEYYLYKTLGLGEDIIARAGTVSLFVVLSNTVMAGNWLVMLIFSKLDLLEQIRQEVSACTTITGNKHVINTTKLKTHCPVLLATFREVLRHYMDFSLNRYVGDDTHVRLPSTDETFSLKKGSIVQIASPLMHQQASIWGEDVKEFRPCRFMPKAGSGCPVENITRVYGVNNKTSVPDPARPTHATRDQKTAYAPFGGGAHICPGRHFAFHIIAAFVGVLVIGYDITGADEKVLVPPQTEHGLGHGIKLAESDVEAVVCKRAGFEQAECCLDVEAVTHHTKSRCRLFTIA